MVGQNLGARRPERAQKAVLLTAFYNALFLGFVSLFFVFMPEVLVGFFTSDPAESTYAIQCLRTIGFGNVIYAFGMVMVQAFNGAGDTLRQPRSTRSGIGSSRSRSPGCSRIGLDGRRRECSQPSR